MSMRLFNREEQRRVATLIATAVELDDGIDYDEAISWVERIARSMDHINGQEASGFRTRATRLVEDLFEEDSTC